jgi:hypothetical protein
MQLRNFNITAPTKLTADTVVAIITDAPTNPSAQWQKNILKYIHNHLTDKDILYVPHGIMEDLEDIEIEVDKPFDEDDYCLIYKELGEDDLSNAMKEYQLPGQYTVFIMKDPLGVLRDRHADVVHDACRNFTVLLMAMFGVLLILSTAQFFSKTV